MIDEGELFRRGAQGDREALGSLAWLALIYGETGNVPYAECLVGAEMFARLAAEHGAPEDLITLAGVLFCRSDTLSNQGESERSGNLLSEAVELLRRVEASGHEDGGTMLATALAALANNGDEGAAIELNALIERMEPATAVEVRAKVAEAMKEMPAAVAGASE